MNSNLQQNKFSELHTRITEAIADYQNGNAKHIAGVCVLVVQRYIDDTFQQAQSIEVGQGLQGVDYYKCAKCGFQSVKFEDYKKHVCQFQPDKDQRVVSRELLEQCYKFVAYSSSWTDEERSIKMGLIKKLEAALQTEKPVLRAP